MTFAVKPLIDLTWPFSIPVGPFKLSALTGYGLLVLLFFLSLRFRSVGRAPPLGRVMELFVLWNVAGAMAGLITSERASWAEALDILVRITDSYLIYFVAYAAARQHKYDDYTPFLRAAFIGSSLAVIANVAAIMFGFGGEKWDQVGVGGVYREVGLYYDSGNLANTAFYNLVFAVFWFHAERRRASLRLALVIVIILCDLFLIAEAKSRIVTVQLLVAVLFYVSVYHRGRGRVVTTVVAVAVAAVAIGLFGIQFSGILERFQGDISTVSSDQVSNIEFSRGHVSLGKFEALGNNRGVLWANAISAIVAQSTWKILLGDFFTGIGGHSDYTDVAARNGVLGLLLYLALIYVVLIRTWMLARTASPPHTRPVRALACLLVVCYALYCFPFRPLLYTTTNWYLWTIVALAFAAAPGAARGSSAPK